MKLSNGCLSCRKAGLFVLKEAIRLAQESSDHMCLQHALAWLYTLSPTHKVSGVLQARQVTNTTKMSRCFSAQGIVIVILEYCREALNELVLTEQ